MGQVTTAVKKEHMIVTMKFVEQGPGKDYFQRLSPGDSDRRLGWNVNAPTFQSRFEDMP